MMEQPEGAPGNTRSVTCQLHCDCTTGPAHSHVCLQCMFDALKASMHWGRKSLLQLRFECTLRERQPLAKVCMHDRSRK